MKKIVLIPIDERPCTYDYPAMMASMAKDINFVEIPREYMGDLKIPGLFRRGNIMGAQFHPEKSGEDGLNILRNFKELVM